MHSWVFFWCIYISQLIQSCKCAYPYSLWWHLFFLPQITVCASDNICVVWQEEALMPLLKVFFFLQRAKDTNTHKSTETNVNVCVKLCTCAFKISLFLEKCETFFCTLSHSHLHFVVLCMYELFDKTSRQTTMTS